MRRKHCRHKSGTFPPTNFAGSRKGDGAPHNHFPQRRHKLYRKSELLERINVGGANVACRAIPLFSQTAGRLQNKAMRFSYNFWTIVKPNAYNTSQTLCRAVMCRRMAHAMRDEWSA